MGRPGHLWGTLMHFRSAGLTAFFLAVVAAFVCALAPLGHAQSGGTYSLDRYFDVRDRSDESLSAFEAAAAGDEDRLDLAHTAVRHRLAVVEYIRRWQASGTMSDDIEAAVGEARIVYYCDVIEVQTAVGDCEDARRTMVALDLIVPQTVATPQSTDRYLEAAAAMSSCRQRAIPVAEVEDQTDGDTADATDEDSATDAQANGTNETQRSDTADARDQDDDTTSANLTTTPGTGIDDPASDGGGASIAPWVLYGVAGAAAVGALIWDGTTGSDRNRYDEIIDTECGGTDTCPESTRDELESLNSSLRSARVGVATLWVAAAGSAVAGTVLLLTQKKPGESNIALAPIIGPHVVGTQVRTRF